MAEQQLGAEGEFHQSELVDRLQPLALAVEYPRRHRGRAVVPPLVYGVSGEYHGPRLLELYDEGLAPWAVPRQVNQPDTRRNIGVSVDREKLDPVDAGE